ncbi:hypothetical protein ACNQFN_08260 [Thauera butanivorans]|uniref:hypothetical protein n=1 Tax=Thauera butanivorans TaxID=86174 RepID=UPI003AB63572
MTSTKESARPTGRSDRAAAEVSATHWEPSLARSQQNGTRWLPNPGSCAGQLLLELIERAANGDDRGVTPRDFYRSVWSQREAAYVFRLRQGGWTIETELREASNRFEWVKHAAYFLVLDLPDDEELQQWLILAREVRA